jgi:RHS repeat-associated protein
LILFLTDQELDAESGLYNYDARLYDPIVGRFISADEVVPDWFNSQSLNRYAYCVNNPLKYKDPTGHLFGLDDAFAVAVGVIAAKAIGFAVGYLGVKAAEKAATMKSDSTTKQNANKNVNSALASAAKTSGVSTIAALGAAGAAAGVGKGYAAAAALTPEKAAIGVMGAVQQPQIAKTIDTIKNLPDTVKSLPDKAKKAAEKTLALTEGLMGQIGSESESQEQNEADGDTADGQSDNDSDTNNDSDTK